MCIYIIYVAEIDTVTELIDLYYNDWINSKRFNCVDKIKYKVYVTDFDTVTKLFDLFYNDWISSIWFNCVDKD